RCCTFALCIFVVFFFFFFFFSSRRRHTRSDRDWSSDVCSSDLAESRLRDEHRDVALLHPQAARAREPERAQPAVIVEGAEIDDRSEERRVGKECRYRWER